MTTEEKIRATLRAAVTIDLNTSRATFDCQVCGEFIEYPFPVYSLPPGDGLNIILFHLLLVSDPEHQCTVVRQEGLELLVTEIVSDPEQTRDGMLNH